MNHPEFNDGFLTPVCDRNNHLLQLYLESPLQDPLGHPDREHYNNQLVTYLIIEPDSGFAPPCSQARIETVIFAHRIERRFYPNILRCCSSSLLISWIVTGMKLSTLIWTPHMLHSNNFTSVTKRHSHGGIFDLHMLM